MQSSADESRAYQWLRRTIDLLAEGDNPEEFLEHTKLELFHDQVFCFTPKGRLIALPRGATPIDFAYAVHTDVGNSAVGARSTAASRRCLTELQNGDEVEITRAEGRRRRPPGNRWSVTGKARAAIRRATRRRAPAICRPRPPDPERAVRARQDGIFRRPAEGRAAAAGAHVRRRCDGGGRTRRDVRAATSRGPMYPDYKEERVGRFSANNKKDGGQGPNARWRGTLHRAASPIGGVNSDLPVQFAPNGGAVPGDRIVGIVTPGEGITIYPIQSPALKDFEEEPERWVDVRWDLDESSPQRFPARIKLQNVNEPGSLAQIAQVIADHDGNIDNISMHRRSPDFTEQTIDLGVYDLKHLSAIINQLRAKAVVAKVERVNG
jgi:guanosine-3',5'-bis(diphosphate) 3'-pyrophosphohydrolase